MSQIDFSALIDGLQWSLDAGCDQLQYPCQPDPLFQFDADSSVYPVPTQTEVQVAPEYDLSDLVLESSFYPQSTAASDMMGLEDASNGSTISPSSMSSSSDIVSMAFDDALDFEDFQWLGESEESSASTPTQSVAEEGSAAPGIIITPPQPLVYSVTVPDQGFAIDRESAGFHFIIEPGSPVKAAPWNFSELMNKLYVNKEKLCPVTFKTAIPAQLQGQFQIVVHVSFAGLQDVHEPVRPCRNHSLNNPEKPAMSCNYPGAKTEIRDRQHAAVFPLDVNYAGQLSAVAGFEFTCWNTCPSIKNNKNQKRNLKLHFRLETRSGQMVDKKALDLKLCSCPGRDRPNEEKVFKTKK